MAKKVKFTHDIGERFAIPFIIVDIDPESTRDQGRYWLESDSGLEEVDRAIDGFWLSELDAKRLSDHNSYCPG